MSLYGLFLPHLSQSYVWRRKRRTLSAHIPCICTVYFPYICRFGNRAFPEQSPENNPSRSPGRLLRHSVSGSLFPVCFLYSLCYSFKKTQPFSSAALLGDPRCEKILILLSYALPFSSIHGCIMGYCYGLKTDTNPGDFSTD